MKRHILLTAGPTPIPPSVSAKLAEPVIYHRTKEFEAALSVVLERMRTVFRTKNLLLIQTSSGTGAMEAAVANLLSPGDKTIVATSGVFGDRWVKILTAYGIEPAVLSGEWGAAVDPDAFRKKIRSAGKGLKAVFLVHTETSTGAANDVQTLSRIVHEESDALVVVDSISGLAAQPLETDAWGLDVVVAASQKGLMCPPGLAFASVSERALAAGARARFPRFYWDWEKMKSSISKHSTPYTPSIVLVMGLKEALNLICREGIENVWEKTRRMAESTRRAFSGMGLRLFARQPCDCVTAALVPDGTDSDRLISTILEKHNISIAGGQGKLKGKIVRIAHMGAITNDDIREGIAALREELR